MLTCKQVSTSLEEKDYDRLTLPARWGLKVHVALCIFCGKYNRQRMIMHDLFRKLRQREDRNEILSGTTLPGDAKARMMARMQEEDPSREP